MRICLYGVNNKNITTHYRRAYINHYKTFNINVYTPSLDLSGANIVFLKSVFQCCGYDNQLVEVCHII